MPSDPATVLLLERLLAAVEGLRADLAAARAAPAAAPVTDALWKVPEVAAFVGCSRSKIYQGAEAGTIPCIRVGGQLRFEPDVIRRWARGDAPATTRVLPIRRPGGGGA